MNEKLQFIFNSILDIQSIIRSIDTKVATLFVILLVPLTSLGKISSHIYNFLSKSQYSFDWIIVLLFIIFWITSIFSAIRVIIAIDNPASHIVNSENFSGIFYAGGLFKPNIIDVFFNRKVLKASRDVENHLQLFPNNQKDIESELVFEQMKLAYIRDIKFVRLNFSIYITFVWLAIGLFIYFVSRFA